MSVCHGCTGLGLGMREFQMALWEFGYGNDRHHDCLDTNRASYTSSPYIEAVMINSAIP